MRQPREIVQRFEAMRTHRAVFESVWEEYAEHVRPIRAEFTGERTAGGRRDSKRFDSAPGLALTNFAGGVYGMMTSPANKWFGLRVEDDDLNEFGPTQDWLAESSEILLKSFSPARSRFYSTLPALYMDWAGFGNGCWYSVDRPGGVQIFDSCRPLGEAYISVNEFEEVDTLYRRVPLTAAQAAAMFGLGRLPANIRAAFDRGDQTKFYFIHAVEPNPGFDPAKRLSPQGKAFMSQYVTEEQPATVHAGGFEEFPFQYPRWDVAAGELYGRGIDIIADAKTLNAMNRTTLVHGQRAAEPPLLAHRSDKLKPLRMYPRGITFNAVTSDGKPLVQALQTGARPEISFEMMEQRRNAIRDALFFSLLIMVNGPNMTATEVLERQEEKIRLMGPNLGRLQTEFLSPLIKRRYAILSRKGMLPPPPEELAGQDLQIEYVSPLAKVSKAAEATAINRYAQSIEGIAGLDPSIIDNFDVDEAAGALAEAFAIPAQVQRDPQERQAMREQRMRQQQMAQMAEQAPGMAKAAKDGAGALKEMQGNAA